MKSWLLIYLLLLINMNLFGQSLFFKNIDKEFLTGKINYCEDARFMRVGKEHSLRQVYLNPTVYEAFIKMADAAKFDGLDLRIVSGARSFEEQKIIWEKKWQSLPDTVPQDRIKRILEFSSMPATSRHHWGTDIDINSVESSYFTSEKGIAEYQWLINNAGKFGFYQVYNNQASGRTGYSEEKWHWSYMPLANFFLRAYNEQVTYADILGFEGADLAEEFSLIASYVNGISTVAIPRAVAVVTAQRLTIDQLREKRKIFVN
ncbi:M15 family metallopeptidase [Antarcticibacterium sp. 1MA-6-2]|uniref:M15 family metallopeptidase n=1 Tax=Antarcticibacterium sp. 1MA-6-2 TaxID=2908210 RepID=UPI001F29FF0D|nr:M15 family metallopeptidase [Antarcticibacterium sp. 1MA-6-2]UJH91388.1 M15 family metallopeptidase [Antarcticibacterium sp. 1MA-6-2]